MEVDAVFLSYVLPPLFCLILILSKPKLVKEHVFIASYIFATLLFITITETYRRNGLQNTFLFISIPYFEFGTLGLYLITRLKNKILFYSTLFIYFLILTTYTLALLKLEPFINWWSFLGNSNYGIFLLLLCLVHYTLIMINQPTKRLLDYPYFWFTSATFCYFGLAFFMLPFLTTNSSTTNQNIAFLSELLHHVPNWLLYSFIFIGLWKARIQTSNI